MRSLSDSISSATAGALLRNSGLSPRASSRFILPWLQPRSRSPYDFVSPRAVLVKAVRARTSPARDCQIRMGFSTAVWHRPPQFRADSCQRARVRASNRSSLRRLSTVRRTLRAQAPRSLHGLVHSIAGSPTASAFPFPARSGWTASRPKISFIAFGVAASFCSNSTSPASSRTQYQLDRSPRSSPMVSLLQNKTGQGS